MADLPGTYAGINTTAQKEKRAWSKRAFHFCSANIFSLSLWERAGVRALCLGTNAIADTDQSPSDSSNSTVLLSAADPIDTAPRPRQSAVELQRLPR